MIRQRYTILIMTIVFLAPPLWAADAPPKSGDVVVSPVQGPPPEMVPQRARGGIDAGDYRRRANELEGRLKQLKSDHDVLVHQLREIRAVAEREKATETLAQLDALLKSRTEAHERRIAAMTASLERLNAVVQRIVDRKVENRAGGKAPDFRLTGTDGKTFRLEALKGKIVVLEWMNPECPFSKQYYEQRVPQKLAEQFEEQGVVWVPIDSTPGQTLERDQAFAEAHGLATPILLDPAGAIAKAYGAKATPHVFIIDAQGVIAYNGAVDDNIRNSRARNHRITHYVEDALSALVAGEKVKVPFSRPFGTPISRP